MSEEHVREVVGYYSTGVELGRLDEGRGQLEFCRTKELLERYLPNPPALVIDVGGADGPYAGWLTEAGYRVHLVDPVPLHVERARLRAATLPEPFVVSLGDARGLPLTSDSADAVLLFGPLYHLPDLVDRLAAWAEARRVLRPGGLAFAIGVSRFAGLLDSLFRPYVNRPGFVRSAYFHSPGELPQECARAGFNPVAELGVEGPGWLLADFDRQWAQPPLREAMLTAARSTEGEPSLLGLHSHFLLVARKPAGG